MAKHRVAVHCVDFSKQEDVKSLLLYLINNDAKITAFDKKTNFNIFAVLTKYRVKEEAK